MEALLRLLPARRQPFLVRYGCAAAAVGICFVVVVSLNQLSGFISFYVMFPAIFGSSIVFDRGSGVFSVAISTILLYTLARPPGDLLPPQPAILALVLFFIIALAVAVISEGLRTAWERAVAAEGTKELLLQEIGHRTKNSLAMVSAVLSLQARSKSNPEVKAALEKAIARIEAIAKAHQYFHADETIGRIEMRSYLSALCNHLGDALRDLRPIAVKAEIEDLHLQTGQAVQVGLIVNELVTNALKHAFPDDRGGTVVVKLGGTSPINLTVSDDGVGCPADRTERLGSRLTRLLAQQLGATITWEPGSPGCRVRAVFSAQ